MSTGDVNYNIAESENSVHKTLAAMLVQLNATLPTLVLMFPKCSFVFKITYHISVTCEQAMLTIIQPNPKSQRTKHSQQCQYIQHFYVQVPVGFALGGGTATVVLRPRVHGLMSPLSSTHLRSRDLMVILLVQKWCAL